MADGRSSWGNGLLNGQSFQLRSSSAQPHSAADDILRQARFPALLATALLVVHPSFALAQISGQTVVVSGSNSVISSGAPSQSVIKISSVESRIGSLRRPKQRNQQEAERDVRNVIPGMKEDEVNRAATLVRRADRVQARAFDAALAANNDPKRIAYGDKIIQVDYAEMQLEDQLRIAPDAQARAGVLAHFGEQLEAVENTLPNH